MKKIYLAFICFLFFAGIGCATDSTSPQEVSPSIADTDIVESVMLDSDNDGLIDADEKEIYKTDPENQDTDGDGYLDGEEIRAGYDPTVAAIRDIKKNQDTDNTPPMTIEINVDPIITTVTCGSDASCMESAFDTCSPATLTSDAGFAAVSYEITGSTSHGCTVTFLYTTNPNPAWVNEPAYCVFDNTLDFITSAQQTIGNAFSTGEGCVGPLIETILAD